MLPLIRMDGSMGRSVLRYIVIASIILLTFPNISAVSGTENDSLFLYKYEQSCKRHESSFDQDDADSDSLRKIWVPDGLLRRVSSKLPVYLKASTLSEYRYSACLTILSREVQINRCEYIDLLNNSHRVHISTSTQRVNVEIIDTKTGSLITNRTFLGTHYIGELAPSGCPANHLIEI